MTDLNIKPQPRLNAVRLFRLTVTAIRFRFFRSLVTVMVITVAMAFLANMLVFSLGSREILAHAEAEIRETREAASWLGKLDANRSLTALLEEWARLQTGDPAWTEIRQRLDLEPAAMERLTTTARRLDRWRQRLEGYPLADRQAYFPEGAGLPLFQRLSDPAGFAAFTAALPQDHRLRRYLPELRAVAGGTPDLVAGLEDLQQARAVAVSRLRTRGYGPAWLAALEDAPGAFGAALREVGYVLPPETAERLANQARAARLEKAVLAAVPNDPLRSAIAARLRMRPEDFRADLAWDLVREERQAAWLLEAWRRGPTAPPDDLTATDLQELAGLKQRQDRLRAAETEARTRGEGLFGLGERTTVLLGVSLLVCAVGIANAMLMSVTERYREIATLKCLGALDGSILTLFVFEAALLGVAGGVLGSILGTLIAHGLLLGSFGPLFIEAYTLTFWIGAALVAVIAATLLAALAAVYPSLKAARLAPMEAMRVE